MKNKLKSVFKKKNLKYLVLFLILLIPVIVNFRLCIFGINFTKTIRLDYSVANITVSDLNYLFDDGSKMSIGDIMDYGNISFAEAVKVYLNPDDYCYVRAEMIIENNTDKDAYDWDYCVHKKGSLYYATSIYEQDSPIFSPVLAGEQSGDVISFIVPKSYIDADISGIESQELQATSLDAFSITIRAANLQKAPNYEEFYG